MSEPITAAEFRVVATIIEAARNQNHAAEVALRRMLAAEDLLTALDQAHRALRAVDAAPPSFRLDELPGTMDDVSDAVTAVETAARGVGFVLSEFRSNKLRRGEQTSEPAGAVVAAGTDPAPVAEEGAARPNAAPSHLTLATFAGIVRPGLPR